MRKKLHSFFRKKITIAKWQFNLFGLAFFVLLVGMGAYVTVKQAFADNIAKTITIPSVSVSNELLFSQGTSDGILISGSNEAEKIKLEIDADIISTNPNYQKPNFQSDITNASGLVSYWKMDGNLSDSDAGSPNNLIDIATGTTTMPVLADGKMGGGLSFDGIDDQVDLAQGSSINLGNNFSVCTWLKTSSYGDIISSSSIGSEGSFLLTAYNGGLSGHIWYEGNSNAIDSSGVSIMDGNWHLGCEVVDDTNISLYIDGGLNVSQPLVGAKTPASSDILFATNRNGQFNGTLDEVGLYNKALSTTEISNLYNAGLGAEGVPDPNLVVGFHFNEAPGASLAVDYSENNYDIPLFSPTVDFTFENAAKYGSSSASFDGTTSAACAPYDPELEINDFSLEMWVNPSENQPEYADIIDRDHFNYGWALQKRGGDLGPDNNFTLHWYHPWYNHLGSDAYVTLTPNVWQHLAITKKTDPNQTLVTYYLNGSQVAQSISDVQDAGFLPTHWGVQNEVCLGTLSANRGDPARMFNGKIDEFAIFNRVLSFGEIAAHISSNYKAGPGQLESAPINLNWNGGWDGTNSFSAEIELPSVDTTVDFFVRSSLSEAELEIAEGQAGYIAYAPIVGTMAGATFTADLNNPDGDSNTTDALPIGENKFFQIKAVLRTTDNTKTPIINSIAFSYLADGDVPTSASNIGMKIEPDGEELFQATADGIHWTSYFQNNNNGYYPNFIWDSSSDGSGSGIKGYCLYLGKNPVGDPASDSSYNDPGNSENSSYFRSDHSMISPGNVENKCHFIVPENSVNGKTTFQSSAEGYSRPAPWNPDSFYDWADGYFYRTDIYNTYDPLYLNIKAIDNENNVSADFVSFKFAYEDRDVNHPAYISLPDRYVSNKATTMSWPVPVVGDLTGEKNKDAANDCYIISEDADGNNRICETMSGLAGYQYKIGNGAWKGDGIAGPEDAVGADLIPKEQGSIIFNENDPDIIEGVNTVYFRAVDNAGNGLQDSWSLPSAMLRIDSTSPSEPLNVAATPSSSGSNSYAFSWAPPTSRVGQISKLDFCYTINTVPSDFSCTFTGQNFCVEDENNRGDFTCSLPAESFATRPGVNIFYVVAKSESGIINYDNYSTVEFSYSGSAPGIARGVDISDISIRTTSNWKLAVSWEQPEDVGAGVDSYKVYRSDKNVSCSNNFSEFSDIGSTAGTSYVDTGLTQKAYYYCVKACDSGNSCSAPSTTVSMLPTGKFTSPAKLISGPETENITTKKAEITWTTERNSDSKIALGDKSGEYQTEETSRPDQVISHAIELSSLSPGKKYYYRAKWTDDDGNTGQSEEKSFETDPAPSVKDAKAEDIGISTAFVKFTTKNATKVKIYYGKSAAFGSAKEISTSDKESEHSVQLENLDDNTKYYFKINTFDVENTEYEGTSLDFTTLPRPKISDVQIQSIKDSAQPGIQVTWNSNTEISSIISYSPINNPTNKQTLVQVDLVLGGHEATIMDLQALTTYELIVRGIDKVGNEATSDTYSFTTASDTRPPQISEIVVEGASTKKEEDKLSQLAISWNTDEASTSQVEFGEGVGTSYTQKTQEDSNLTNNHLVIISGLTPSKVYHLRIISKDQIGNIATSQDTVSITPKAVDSAFELVIGNLVEVFGFLKGLQN